MATKQEFEQLFQVTKKPKQGFYPNVFHGQITEDAREFLYNFQEYCARHKLSTEEKLNTLRFSLDGDAKAWLLGLSPSVQENYEQVRNKFIEQYLQRKNWMWTARKEARRLPTKSAAAFVSHLASLAALTGASDQELETCITVLLN